LRPLAPAPTRPQVLVEERLAEAADRRGNALRAQLRAIAAASGGLVTAVRGKGLLNAIVVQVWWREDGRCQLAQGGTSALNACKCATSG
jgi:acetylornithine/succinyldiaminopimelate/putrescine aminotransferase